ncbi:hypothetical protein QA600_05220 [Natronococcus sp. A-GB1]|uniref:hypothetical protein n=1 Tax=Natronococcus sp. A-GB1 TaxID=3037648 RepID=UPI00241DC1C2|nr:hypothetical protein [Natronococcus sp. A-GB1]MDG5758736.1 hypothetical protein [Natronococcus sp. A-GB1]
MNRGRMALISIIGLLGGVIVWLPVFGGDGFDTSAYFDPGTIIAIAFLFPVFLAMILFGYMAAEKGQSDSEQHR